MKRILVAIPCYNCEKQVSRLALKLDQFISTFKSHDFEFEKIIFIDNQSLDSTVSILQKKLPSLKNNHLFFVYQNSQNIGLGGTHKIAFQWLQRSPCDYMLVIHGDDQAVLEDIQTLLKCSMENNFKTVLGSRFMSHSTLINYSPLRRFGNMALNRIYSLLLCQKVLDLGSGLNLFAKKDFKNSTLIDAYDDGFTFNMDVLIGLSNEAPPLLFSAIQWQNHDQVSNAKIFKVGIKALLKILSWKIFGSKIWKDQNAAPERLSHCVYEP